MELNVVRHPEYGQFTIALQLNVAKLDASPDLELIKSNLKKIKKAKTFLFFPSKPGDKGKEDTGRIIELVGIEYKELSGSIRPVYGKHADFLGYECTFSAVKKYAEGYDPISKGLTKRAINELEVHLGKDLEEKVTQSKDWLIEQALKQYFESIQSKAKNTCDFTRNNVVVAQRKLQKAIEAYDKEKEAYKQVQAVINIAKGSTKKTDGQLVNV